ncbi:MAG: response regulator transcription factor [Candidatus Kerfeldbacteria bacterium]|nr:response regulator transcription factor [Candidatus Kerfeldbacteria bacterium]
MRILVIDDNQHHLNSAKELLKEHKVTLCSTADEAIELLEPQYDDVIFHRLWSEKGWEEASQVARLPYWDVVLSDLLMPAPKRNLSYFGEKFIGQEMPVGWAFVLRATLEGAKFAAVVTATNHHNHPASALLDPLGSAYWEDNRENAPKFTINGATVGFYHAPMIGVDTVPCSHCNVTGRTDKICSFCEGTKKEQGKNWALVLKALTS